MQIPSDVLYLFILLLCLIRVGYVRLSFLNRALCFAIKLPANQCRCTHIYEHRE